MHNFKILLLLLGCILYNLTFGQIVFVDVNPDSCVCVTSSPSNSVTLTTNWDLDNDAIDDFQIISSSYYLDCTHGVETAILTPLGNSKVAGDSLCNNCTYAFMLNFGDTINTQPSWISKSLLRRWDLFSGLSGYWVPQNTFKYAGIKFYSGSSLYYGWIRLSFALSCGVAKIIISEYAYSTSMISAGEGSTTTSIHEKTISNSSLIYPNPAGSSFTLKLDNNIKKGQLVLINSVGQRVYTQNVFQGENSIESNNLTKGIYQYLITSDGEQIGHGKLLVE